MCVCVCVCVCERERERERVGKGDCYNYSACSSFLDILLAWTLNLNVF